VNDIVQALAKYTTVNLAYVDESGDPQACAVFFAPTENGSLVATTSSAARLLGFAGELGRLAPGHRADVVVVAGDPYDFGGLAGNVREVWQDGVRAV